MNSIYFNYMQGFWKSILLRLVRGFLAGFFSTAATMAAFSGMNLHDIGQWVALLIISGVAGGITGLILAGDKFFRSTSPDIPQI